MNVNEIMEMPFSELTFQQFVTVFFTLLVCTAFVVIIFFTVCEILKILVDFVFYLVCRDKRNGGYWFNLRLCRYIASLRKKVIHSNNDKAFYLYYNRLIGAVNFGLEMGFYSNERASKFLDVRCKYDYNKIRSKIYEGE